MSDFDSFVQVKCSFCFMLLRSPGQNALIEIFRKSFIKMVHTELQPEDVDDSVTPFYAAVKRTWSAFCDTTSIHCLKYTKDAETNRIVRFVWMLIGLVMFTCAVVMVVHFYFDYRTNPTRMNVENDHVPVSTLLFPAVTICPEVLYNMQKSKRYIETLKLPPNVSSDTVLQAINVGYGFVSDDERYSSEEIDLLETILELNNISVWNTSTHFRWSCTDMIFRCRFSWKIYDCSELFQFARAYFGSCCAFNLKQWGMNFTNKYARPGLRDGLSIILYYNDTLYDQVRSYSYGFRLILGENDAFPSPNSATKFVPLGEEVFIGVRPVETFCSTAVKNLPFEERQCVFPDEYPLKYFPKYVGSNCELNCHLLNMKKFCGCVAFYFDSISPDESFCSYSNIPCLVENFAHIIGRYRNTQCDCPISCEMIDYDLQLTSANLQLQIPSVDSFYKGIKEEYSVAHIFMNSQVYRRVRHDLLSNIITLVSNLGSAFSLFVGMSMISAVEILYYLTVILRKYYVQEVKARQKITIQKREALVKVQQKGQLENLLRRI